MSAERMKWSCQAKAWTPAYFQERQAILERAVADAALMERFTSGDPLPAGYGAGLDERCVEYPWALAHLRPGNERLLDAGSALNHPWLLDQAVFSGKDFHILTLAPEPYCAWQKGFSYIFADLRDIPVRDGFYDRIVSISTLEHVGFDTSPYTGGTSQAEPSWLAYRDALAELRRVLRPGGELLVTLPYGRKENLVIAQQFDAAALAGFVEAFGPGRAEMEFFKYSPEGWQRAGQEQCAGSAYVRWAIDFFLDTVHYDLARAVPESDGAAAARSVACLRLVKKA
jgi:SAM-dependent methyltransferase